MNISTNDQIDLCDVVAQKIVEIAEKQGKQITHDEVFNMLFGGDYCDIFDGILGVIK